MGQHFTHDRDRLRAAFSTLRDRGWWSRMSQPGGWGHIPEGVHRNGEKVVFWHAHESSAFNEHGDLVAPLHLHHRYADATEIGAILTQFGLTVEYQGTPNAIEVVVLPVGYVEAEEDLEPAPEAING